MYDIRQFKPALYLLLMMGMTGYALAAESPGTWVLSIAGLLFNAWLVKTRRFRPMPRLVANLVTVIATAYAFLIFRRGAESPILIIGQFLVLLQLVKLFEQRSNRDFAQLLVLSLLLMVAASINTASLIFGVLLILYLFLSLYCCLLFHLKVETDHAKAAIGIPDEKLNPMTLRQDQRYLSHSMRRLTSMMSFAAIAMAVLVFLFFPRNTGTNLLGPLSIRQPQTLTGFSERVSFQQVAQISQNSEIVAYVKLWHNGRSIDGTEPLLLRGVTLDIYSGNDPDSFASPWQWMRTPLNDAAFDFVNQSRHAVDFNNQGNQGEWKQEITLRPTGTEVLFALGGVTDFASSTVDGKIRFQPRDLTLRCSPAIDKQVTYEVNSTGRMFAGGGVPRMSGDDLPLLPDGRRVLSKSVIDDRITQYAGREAVSGADANGSLAVRRSKAAYVTPLDQQIAGNIERHLRISGGFSYTLDLTDAKGIGDGRDPIVAFLHDLKRGHCEYFAGAMTLMCQSLGLQARMVVGFKVDGADFNRMVHSYVVRQSHAHAWVEVLNDHGEWIAFDPTSGREADDRKQASLWGQVKQFYDYLEYTWANSVVAYNRERRANVIQNVEEQLGSGANTGANTMRKAREQVHDWFSAEHYWVFSSKMLSIMIAILLSILLLAVLWFVLERWHIRRRARRIGLDTLPPDAQMRLARQLGFYDDLLRLLSRHNINCPAHLTPLEFSQSIAFLPSELFDAIYRMTEIFYQVRFGRASLTVAQQRHLRNVLERVEAGLAGRADARTTQSA